MRPCQKTHCFLRMVSIALWQTLPFGEKSIPISLSLLALSHRGWKELRHFLSLLEAGQWHRQSCYWGVNLSLMESSWTGFWFPDERNTHRSHCSLSPSSICACWDDAWTCCSHLAIMKWKKKMRAKCHHTKESKAERQKGLGPLASLESAYFQVSCCLTHGCQYCLNHCWSVSAAWSWKHSCLSHAASKNIALMMKLSLLT